MHFVSGGACNGKSAWVKQQSFWREDALWVSAYRKDQLPQDFKPLTVIEGLEEYIRLDSLEHGEDAVRIWSRRMEEWISREQERRCRLVLIGTDITKGIVPVQAEDRLWRDTAGWVYQEIVRKAAEADLIWYGLATPLKRGAGN
ncbi:hypothetical protein GKZ89_06460 [Bacillus mangrovi]|uniref:Adenosylcobinamide kinase n=1 Tax=Metabacillus mangrovi TaxID=1491830 RepID=A0A7X2S3K0_9BACI|nr:bifunctional adenosylcobinamide kinase/adenosylcobinamide-phosphate guanylyltransferase [Metabacillus mangrovi]MTH53049.1 hypothetical protein [Metabacillus mangrovi]